MGLRQIFRRKPLETLLAEMAGEHRLHRVLGPISLTSLGVGAIIGAGIFAMLLTHLRETFALLIGPGIRAALAKFDYFSLWLRALDGQLPVSEVCVQLSLGVLWLFLTVKVLEARKWS